MPLVDSVLRLLLLGGLAPIYHTMVPPPTLVTMGSMTSLPFT